MLLCVLFFPVVLLISKLINLQYVPEETQVIPGIISSSGQVGMRLLLSSAPNEVVRLPTSKKKEKDIGHEWKRYWLAMLRVVCISACTYEWQKFIHLAYKHPSIFKGVLIVQSTTELHVSYHRRSLQPYSLWCNYKKKTRYIVCK